MRGGDDAEEFEDELQWGDDLVKNLIKEIPEHRLSAEEAKFHPFFADVVPKDPDLQHAEEAIKNATTLPLHRLHNSGF
ncbi:hypothetical protein BGZ91_001134 [Linnemannia elongata]|nr:hypothetical protein BGZ91_001134 [Linnemannia elongata]KAG0065007.1 hypothetical protein BGZ90_001965 [Linnemannia elongata]